MGRRFQMAVEVVVENRARAEQGEIEGERPQDEKPRGTALLERHGSEYTTFGNWLLKEDWTENPPPTQGDANPLHPDRKPITERETADVLLRTDVCLATNGGWLLR